MIPMAKRFINDLALFGGPRAFESVRSTSNLVQPEIEYFFHYTRRIYESRRITDNGPLVQELERRLADIHQTAYCVTSCSGFMALMICMRTLAIRSKSEVIMPSLTYRRLADIAAWAGLVPHFCDVDELTLAMTAQTVEPCINSNTALIVGVHPITNLCDIDGLQRISTELDIPLLFDAVEAAWASHGGKMVGSFGKAEVFSLHASKLLNGFEGGYITTNEKVLADELRRLSRFGFSGDDHALENGLNAKLSEVHAAMALACLDDLDDQIVRNKTRHLAYRELLRPIEGLDVLPYDETEKRGYKNVLARINSTWPLSRENTLRILHAENLLARPYYFPPLHTTPTTYKTYQSNDLHTTETLSSRYMLLPCGDFVSVEDICDIAEILAFLQDKGMEISDQIAQEQTQ
jgi:dTDP-4-amino-4,6-dideoxygalactose transaminase